MAKDVHHGEISLFEQVKDVNWREYYLWLLSIAKRFVFVYRIPCWYGQ